MGVNYVNHFRRHGDPVMYTKEDEYAGNARIYGETPEFTTGDDEEKWQIKLVSYESGVIITTFANSGKYNTAWADRAIYFPQLPITGPDFPSDPNGSSEKPGLTGPAVYTAVTINPTTWTALPSLANRQTISFRNNTGETCRVNFTQPAGFLGTQVLDNETKAYDIQESVIVYVKSELNTVVIDVEEIAG